MAKQPTTETRTDSARRPVTPNGRTGADALVSLLLRLQSSLDPETLLDVLASELRRLVDFTQLRYRDPAGELVHQTGRAGRCQAVYQLTADDGEYLGEVRVARSRAFSEDEHRLMEQALGLFQYPLRNALAHDRLKAQVRRDPLTGLLNRAAVEDHLERELCLSRRHGENLSVLVLDVNDFKRVNDEYGHRAGDAMLQHIADLMGRSARHSDLLFRYAGDEFVILASRASEDGATRLAQRLNALLDAEPLVHEGRVIPATVSIGIAMPTETDSARTVFDRADFSMYAAKRAGEGLRIGQPQD